MLALLFLVLGVAGLYGASALYNARKVQKTLGAKQVLPRRLLPETVSAFMLTVQAAELVRVVEHATVINMLAAFMLLAVVVASRSGTESHLH